MDADASMSRRTFLKTTAGASATLGAASSGFVSSGIIGRSQALAPLGAAGLVKLTGLAGAVYVGHDLLTGGGGDVDPDSPVEEYVHATASAIESQRERDRENIDARFVSPSYDKTDFANSAFDEFEGYGVAAIFDEDENNPEAVAQDALDQHVTRAVANALNGYAEALVGSAESDAFVAAMVAEHAAGTEQIEYQEMHGGSIASGGGEPQVPNAVPDGWEPVESSEALTEWPDGDGTGEYHLFRRPWSDNPADFEAAGVDEPPYLYGIAVSGAGSVENLAVPYPSDSPLFPDDADYVANIRNPLTVTHSSLNSADVLDGGLYKDYLSSLSETYQQYQTGEVPDWIGHLMDLHDQGLLSPHDVLSPSQLMDQFGDGDGSSMIAAAAAAAGIQQPDGYGTQFLVSHPDLSESRWGDLFISWSDTTHGDVVTVEAGDVIESDEFDAAYLGFEANGEYITRFLSGSEGMTIEDIDAPGSEMDFTETGGYTDPSAEPTESEVNDRLEQIADRVADIEDANSPSVPGLPGSGGLLPSIPSYVWLIVVAVLGFFGLQSMGGSGSGGTTIVSRGGRDGRSRNKRNDD